MFVLYICANVFISIEDKYRIKSRVLEILCDWIYISKTWSKLKRKSVCLISLTSLYGRRFELMIL